MKSITDFFGETRDMSTITRGEARDWHRQALARHPSPPSPCM
jgi:hypothetical protein